MRSLEDFAQIASDWFWEMDESLRFSYFSGRFQQVTGAPPTALIGRTRREVSANSDNLDQWRDHFEDLEAHRPFRDFIYPFKHGDGGARWFKISGQPRFDHDGIFVGYLGVGTDVTAERAAQQDLARALDELRETNTQLERQNLHFDAALNNMSPGLCMFDGAQRLIVCNKPYAKMYGLTPELTKPGTTLRTMLEHRTAANIYPDMDPQEHIEQRLAMARVRERRYDLLELRDGRVFSILVEPMPDNGWLATHEDITERKIAEAKIAHMARHDSLTDLANRGLFRERLTDALDVAKRDGSDIAVLCLDLDHFKAVNDTLGHPTGDALLARVAERIRSAAHENDTVARLGGDEFAVLMPVATPKQASALARRIISLLGELYDVEGHQIDIGASVGIAMGPADGNAPDQILRSSDMALYRAKAEGRGTYRFFEPDMDASMQIRRLLEIDLRHALKVGEFELHYQPFVTTATGQISGFEALLRWRHPTRGMIAPMDFIPLAEETGLILPLGEWIMRRACADAANWPKDVRIAVNVSAVQFKSSNLVPMIVSALASSGIAAHRLEIEITESVLLHENEATLAKLHQLRGLGVRISMDDFGTGYSSLSYLRSFPFDKIKIDRSFVADLDKKADCAIIVRAVASLGRSLGMSTTAEGVETTEEFEHLRADGCTEVQGYLFSRPKPLAETLRLLAANTEDPSQAYGPPNEPNDQAEAVKNSSRTDLDRGIVEGRSVVAEARSLGSASPGDRETCPSRPEVLISRPTRSLRQ